MSAVLEVLRAGRARIARGWTQGTYARRASDVETEPRDPKATCWCIMGAIYADPSDAIVNGDAVFALHCALPGGASGPDVAEYNDLPTTTQSDVIALFDRAIVAMETP